MKTFSKTGIVLVIMHVKLSIFILVLCQVCWVFLLFCCLIAFLHKCLCSCLNINLRTSIILSTDWLVLKLQFHNSSFPNFCKWWQDFLITECLPVEECVPSKSNKHHEPNQRHIIGKKNQGFYDSTCFQVY